MSCRQLILAVSVLSCGIAPAQVKPTVSFLETAISQPGVRIVWSQEIARLEGGESRAIFTGLVVEDPERRDRRIRGVRIDFLGRDTKRTIHIDEAVLQPLQRISHQLSIGLANAPPRPGAGTREGYIGSCEFRDNPGMYPLDFDYCYSGSCSPGLRIHSPALILFPGKNPGDLSEIFAAILEQLKPH